MRATFQRGLYGEERQSLEIEEGVGLSVFQKGEPVPDSEHCYMLCWTNAEYRETCFDAPRGLVVSIYLTDAEYRQMATVLQEANKYFESPDSERLEQEGVKKEEP